MKEKTNKLIISLIKEEYKKNDQIVDPGAATGFPIDGIGIFYAESSKIRQPDWLIDFFGNTLASADFKLRVSSAKAVLLVPIQYDHSKRIFAITFGQGRHLLNDDVIEERFGLKVVLNTVDPDSLRSIDKTTLGSNPKQSREQISHESSAATFGIDIEQDLVNAVTGKSQDERLGKTISGRNPLALSAKFNVHNIKDLLKICLEKYHSDAYKKNFGWIDQVRHLRDTALVNNLNFVLVEKLAKKELARIWMAAPDILDWVDTKGFRYLRKKSELHDDLRIGSYLAALGDKTISFTTLNDTLIYAISTKSDDISGQWKAFQCLYAEIEMNGKIYLLNNGKWYEIAKDFTNEVLKDFDATPYSQMQLLDYEHDDEGKYNEALAQFIPGSCCMDAKNISYGGGHSKIEFCDVLTKDKKLIHVKRYSGSAQLSHLFAQGVVSGELMLQDAGFRAKVNEKLPKEHKFPNVVHRPEPQNYEIIFAIISESKSALEIPFFSKVTFRNTKRRLQAYGYTVTKTKIVRKKAG